VIPIPDCADLSMKSCCQGGMEARVLAAGKGVYLRDFGKRAMGENYEFD
jgi:hypothetical protein